MIVSECVDCRVFAKIVGKVCKEYLSVSTFDKNVYQNIRKTPLVKCPDQITGIVKIANRTKWFNLNIDYWKCPGQRKVVFHETYQGLPGIFLILESPHKEEFTVDGTPLGSAMGKTGSNIEKYLKNVLEQAKASIKSGTYKLVLINAINFQTSLGVDTNMFRDLVFYAYWEKRGRIRFREKLRNMNFREGDILINCCTQEGRAKNPFLHEGNRDLRKTLEIFFHVISDVLEKRRKLVGKEIMNIVDSTKLSCYHLNHPSSWHWDDKRTLKNELYED